MNENDKGAKLNLPNVLLITGIFLAALVLLFPATAFAQCTPGLPCNVTVPTGTANDPKEDGRNRTCDGDIMNQMYSLAHMHAVQDVVMGETIVRRADSVLELTCFNQIPNYLALNGEGTPVTSGRNDGTFFSETDFWVNPPPTTDICVTDFGPCEVPVVYWMGNIMDEPLELLVQDVLPYYIDNGPTPTAPDAMGYMPGNFPYDFLGGEAVGMDHTIVNTIELPPYYSCAHMDAIWMLAKCRNFAVDDPWMDWTDNVNDPPPLNDFVETDPRILPTLCSPPGTSTINVEDWMVLLSINDEFQYADGYQDFLNFFPLYEPPLGSCPTPPIPTGLTVTQYQYDVNPFPLGTVRTILPPSPFPEHVCFNPGCWYDANTGQCEPP